MCTLIFVIICLYVIIYPIVCNYKKKRENEQKYSCYSQSKTQYVCNMKTNVFHRPNCPCVKNMNEYNSKGEEVKWRHDVSYQTMIAVGFKPCNKCKPK